MANQTLPPPVDIAVDIEQIIDDFLAVEVAQLHRMDPALTLFADVIRDLALAGGKRLRPWFAYWGWRAAAGPREPVGPVLPALAALELLHTFALIHDDVMDGSVLRRGRPSAHTRYAAQHAVRGWRGSAERFGTGTAILAGDLCLVWADRLMATATVPAGALAAARIEYDAMRVEAVAGQYLDLLGEAAPGGWSLGQALGVARYKSACYTVARPLRFGAALAGSATNGNGFHDGYGIPVGEAFQLRDDLLGIYGDPATTGKPAGDDLRLGKPTTPFVLARRLATGLERALLDRGDPAAQARVIHQTGARARVEEMINERIRSARAALAGAALDETVRDALLGLAEAATARSR